MNITLPIHPSPFLYNQVVGDLQQDLSILSWLERVYPLCDVGEVNINDVQTKIPVVYGQEHGKINYINLFPNSNITAQLFFQTGTTDMQFDFTTDSNILPLEIIVTANLKRIANRSYDFTDELIQNVLQVLKNGSHGSMITGATVVKDKDRIFERYGYTFEQLKTFSFPYTSFKIEFNVLVEHDINCNEIIINQNSGSCF